MHLNSWGLLGSGATLLAVAGILSSAAVESLAGREPGSLRWGPGLFRVLLACHGALLIFLSLRRAGPEPVQPRPHTARQFWIVLGSLMACGLALRLWQLDTCLWLDEVLTLVEFARKPLAFIVTSFPNQNQHMLYSILAHWSMLLFGESAWALRLPAVFFSVAAIWALFLLGRVVIGERGAILACALMTFSYHHIWFAQNARGYSALLFFATLGTWLWLEALERKSWRWWTWYAVVACLGVLAHLTMLFVLAAQGLVWAAYLAARGRFEVENRWRPVAAWILGATLTLQALALSLPQFLREALHETSMNSQWTNPMWAVLEAFRSFRIGFSSMAVLAGGAAFLLLGWLSMLRRNPRAALIILLPGVLGGGLMLVLGHNLWPRFFYFSAGAALLIVVEGAMAAARVLMTAIGPLHARARWAPAIGAAFVLSIVAASAITVPRCYAAPKQDYIGARDFAEAARGSGGMIVSAGLAARVYGAYYAPHWPEVRTVQELNRLRTSHDSVSLVYTLPFELEAFNPELWRVIQRDFETMKVFYGTLGGGEVYVCRERTRTEVRTSNAQGGRGEWSR